MTRYTPRRNAMGMHPAGGPNPRQQSVRDEVAAMEAAQKELDMMSEGKHIFGEPKEPPFRPADEVNAFNATGVEVSWVQVRDQVGLVITFTRGWVKAEPPMVMFEGFEDLQTSIVAGVTDVLARRAGMISHSCAACGTRIFGDRIASGLCVPCEQPEQPDTEQETP